MSLHSPLRLGRDRLPTAYGGCSCACHRMPSVFHCVPCCRPGDVSIFERTRRIECGLVFNAQLSGQAVTVSVSHITASPIVGLSVEPGDLRVASAGGVPLELADSEHEALALQAVEKYRDQQADGWYEKLWRE